MTTPTARGRLDEVGRLRDSRERQRSGADLRPVVEDVVRHAEDRERGDARREPRQAHQRDADEQCEDAAGHAARASEATLPTECSPRSEKSRG